MSDNREYVERYINEINKELDAFVITEIKDAVNGRYPLYSNGISRTFYINDDLFSILTEEQKKLEICFSYAVLLDVDISTRNLDKGQEDSIRLAIDPNKLTKVICKLMGVEYHDFDRMQIIAYHQIRQALPNLEFSFYRVGDIIRDSLIHYIIDDIFTESGEIMVKAHSVNSFISDNVTKILIKPEVEMVGLYRIISPADTQND